MGTMDQPLRLTDEQARMVTQAGAGYETRERFFARVHAQTGVDPEKIPAGVPEDLLSGSIVARRRAPADQPDDVVVTHGYPDEHFPDAWTKPESYRLVQLPTMPVASMPTGHIRIAWLALLGAVALLLAAPVAVADPPPATVPDAGVKSKPRQPTHWERWPQGGPRGGAGDPPTPSTGEEKPG